MLPVYGGGVMDAHPGLEKIFKTKQNHNPGPAEFKDKQNCRSCKKTSNTTSNPNRHNYTHNVVLIIGFILAISFRDLLSCFVFCNCSNNFSRYW